MLANCFQFVKDVDEMNETLFYSSSSLFLETEYDMPKNIIKCTLKYNKKSQTTVN